MDYYYHGKFVVTAVLLQILYKKKKKKKKKTYVNFCKRLPGCCTPKGETLAYFFCQVY